MKLKHLLSVTDLTNSDVGKIMKLAKTVKEKPHLFRDDLRGRSMGLLFEKPSTRTRISFQVGMGQMGGWAFYLSNEVKLDGVREDVRDIARVLNSYLDVVVLRTFSHETMTRFAEFSTIPVINGLSDLYHPCQALSDLFTIQEWFGEAGPITVAYVGDGNNVLHSLMQLLPQWGMTLHYATPRGYEPKTAVVKWVKQSPKARTKVKPFYDPKEAVKNADVVYTDVWVSMGEEGKAREKKKHFKGFQVNAALLRHAKKGAKVMHCLPCHRGEEITDGVVEGEQSIVFQQAENRLHVQKAILLHSLTK